MSLWKASFSAIVQKGGLIFGLGHGSMVAVVETSNGGLAPHNYYLWMWGNSGILCLLMLLVFHFVLFQQAWKCPVPEVRAGLLAIATVLAVNHLFDSSFLEHPFVGALFSCVAVSLWYGKRQHIAARQRPALANRPLRFAY